MSTGSDLTAAFGRPARDLSQRLSRNPRRARREENDEAPTSDPPVNAHDPVTDDPADANEAGEPDDAASGGERHLAAAPEATHQTASAAPRTGQVAAPPNPAPRPTRDTGASAGERATASRGRRAPAHNRGRGAPRSTTSSDLDPTTSYQVPVYVHPGVRNAATDRRKTEKLTNAEIAFDALDEVQHRLTALIRDRRLQARPDSSLFPGRVRRGRLAGGGAAAAVGDARRVLWGFRATGAELEIIDRLVADTGAESRSELVAVALEETLLR